MAKEQKGRVKRRKRAVSLPSSFLHSTDGNFVRCEKADPEATFKNDGGNSSLEKGKAIVRKNGLLPVKSSPKEPKRRESDNLQRNNEDISCENATSASARRRSTFKTADLTKRRNAGRRTVQPAGGPYSRQAGDNKRPTYKTETKP